MRTLALLLTGTILFSGTLSGCSGPLGPIPGGKLEGEVAPWPSDWTFTETVENVLLETNPDDPYSVTIWNVAIGNLVYIAAGDSESAWVKNMRANPAVLLKINHKLYPATVSQVIDTTKLLAIQDAYVAKYDVDPNDNFIEEGGILFELRPRTL